MPVDRSAIRSNAKYLRQVRPIDPDEIADYVPGRPDPRLVREVLREEATDLSIVELADGTFVPVEEGPLRPAMDTVGALPSPYGDALLELLVDRWGTDWYQGESGNRLRTLIRRLKADYYRQNTVEYDLDVALAYAVYHLTNYYAATTYVLEDLASDGRLNRHVSVLDVGAGVGGPALALHDVYFEADNVDSPPLVDYTALEPSEAAIVLERLLEETSENFHSRIVRKRAESFRSDRAYDVIVFANVLSELDDPVSVVETYLERLADDGTMVLLAPADRNTSIHLREVEREVERSGGTVYGPTVRLWPGEQPSDEGWSFDRRPDVEIPHVQERLAAGADRPDEFTNTDVKFSYSFLRRDGRQRFDLSLSTDDVAKMAEMEHHVSSRIDLVAAKQSRDLGSDGHPVYKVSDGSETSDHFAVLVRKTATNSDLATADYGALLKFQQVLTLWNDDENAFNLIVDDRTFVDRLA